MAKGINRSKLFDGIGDEEKVPPVHTHDDTHTHTHKHEHTPKVRERKTFRAQILTYPSLIERLDAYAKAHDLSRAEAFERAVTEFLENNT